MNPKDKKKNKCCAFFFQAVHIGTKQDTPSAGLTSTDALSMHCMMRPQDEGNEVNINRDNIVSQPEAHGPGGINRMESQASKEDGSDARNTPQADDNDRSATPIAQSQEDELDTAVCSTFIPG